MLFNSISYAIFLPIVFLLYWCIANKHLKYQNALLLLSSYYFYACWDYRFLFLLIFSTVLDYATGIQITQAASVRHKKFWFWLSIIINLGFLGIFKYYNFFATSFADLLLSAGIHVNFWILQVILPVGISFYTFHGLSYVIDIYNNRIQPERNFIDYSVFVCFFPLLVAGPIERATHLLPQIQRKRHFDYLKAVDGLRQILWGLFKKVVIADNCAEYVNMIYKDPMAHSGSTLLLAAVFFTFQIYCDFSGYSDIALGTARLFGIELLRNFAYPYFSKSITEFWRRWHISLSTWFNDYLFKPLVTYLRSANKLSVVAGIMTTFFLSGLWHGAGWNFIVYGCLHGIAISYEFYTKKTRKKIFGFIPDTLGAILSQLFVFSFVTCGFIFFRSKNCIDALRYIKRILSDNLLIFPELTIKASIQIILIVVFMLIEWFAKDEQYALAKLFLEKPKFIRLAFYSIVILSIICFAGKEQAFIYFQF